MVSARAVNIFKLLIVVNISMLMPTAHAQSDNKQRIDSLLELSTNNSNSAEQVDVLIQLARIYTNRVDSSARDSARTFSSMAIERARDINYKIGLAEALLQAGKYYVGVDFKPAVASKYLLESLDIFTQLKDNKGISRCNMQLGVINYSLEYFSIAIKYLERSLEATDYTTPKYLLALSYTELDSFDLAKTYFSKSIADYTEAQQLGNLDQCFQWLGRLHLKMGKLDSALFNIKKSIAYRETQSEVFGLVRPYAFVAEVYYESNDLDKTIHYAKRSYEIQIDENTKLKDNISLILSTKILSKVYAKLGDYQKAHYFLDLTTQISNQLSGGLKQKVADMQSLYEFEQEIKLQKIRQQNDKEIAKQQIAREKILRNAFLVGSVLLLLLLAVLYNRFNLKKRANQKLSALNKDITHEKERSDELLLNILPKEVAEELKSKGHAEAQLIENVTVLFTDFKGFTVMSEKLSPKELVKDLHECFSEFDRICKKYGIEKIKTIGDAYMAASGLPLPSEEHARNIIKASIEMRKFIEMGKQRKIDKGLPYFEIRIGAHTGPVVAGIVGVRKFQYDIWGDTVNTASRMESAGEAGKINISQTTYELLKNDKDFAFESRGLVNVKGKGDLEMYFVKDKEGPENMQHG